MFSFLFLTVCAISVLLLTTLLMTLNAQREVEIVNELRFQSYLLADELRQSSDDLTRLARTYVVTGDEAYEQQYMKILDIRNGKKPRPLHYERIYWDFIAAGKQNPRPDGETISLQDLMKKLVLPSRNLLN